jgi:hypothetical protein
MSVCKTVGFPRCHQSILLSPFETLDNTK